MQKRAALGNLRNFFGAQNARPYMVRGAVHQPNPWFWRSVPNGGFARLHVPKTGILISGKKVFVFWGLSSVQWGAVACPQNGETHFPKTRLGDFRGCTARWHVPKTGKLIFRKQCWTISGGAINRCPTHRRFHRSQTVPMHCRMFRALFSAIGR